MLISPHLHIDGKRSLGFPVAGARLDAWDQIFHNDYIKIITDEGLGRIFLLVRYQVGRAGSKVRAL